MRIHRPRQTETRHNARRHGTTLTEVLMSLMIMSIGVVSLATLFPISAARVLDATNLTNSTVLKFNAESFVDAYPSIIHEPDGNYSTREGGTNYIVDPLGFWDRYKQLDLFDNGTIDNSVNASTEPLLIYFEYNRPGVVNRPALARPAGGSTIPMPSRFLGDNPSAPNLFGGATIDARIDIARRITTLPDTTTEYGEGFPDPTGSNAGAYVLNGDGRITGLVLPKEINLAALTLVSTAPDYQAPSLYQAVIFDKDSSRSEVRQLTTVTDTGGGLYGITWEQDLNNDGDTSDPGEDRALPLHFSTDPGGVPNVGLVKVEQPVSNYTWILSVRKSASGPANVDVVVFNKRDFSEFSEQYYIGDLRPHTLGDDQLPGKGGYDDNFNGVTDEAAEIGYPATNPDSTLRSDDLPNNRVLVDWTTASGYSTAPLAPPLRRGAYIYDPVNGLWYRVRDVEEVTAADLVNRPTTDPDTAAIVVLDQFISRKNTEDLSGDGTITDIPGEDTNTPPGGTPVFDRGGVIIPKGVIAVFPLETKVP